jgi:signal peptidase II
MLKKYFLNFFFIIIIFCIDRISKLLVIKFAETYGEMNVNVASFLNLNLIWNEGIAFGLFSFDQKFYYNLLTIFIFLIILVIIWLMFKSKGFEKFSYIMIIGGSLGNIFDRIYYSAVPDFIDIYFNNFHWFIFNVADIFISLGVIILISLEFLKKKHE